PHPHGVLNRALPPPKGAPPLKPISSERNSSSSADAERCSLTWNRTRLPRYTPSANGHRLRPMTDRSSQRRVAAMISLVSITCPSKLEPRHRDVDRLTAMYILRGDVPRPVRTVRGDKEWEANCCLYVGFPLLIPPDLVNRSTSPCRWTTRKYPRKCPWWPQRRRTAARKSRWRGWHRTHWSLMRCRGW